LWNWLIFQLNDPRVSALYGIFPLDVTGQLPPPVGQLPFLSGSDRSSGSSDARRDMKSAEESVNNLQIYIQEFTGCTHPDTKNRQNTIFIM